MAGGVLMGQWPGHNLVVRWVEKRGVGRGENLWGKVLGRAKFRPPIRLLFSSLGTCHNHSFKSLIF